MLQADEAGPGPGEYAVAGKKGAVSALGGPAFSMGARTKVMRGPAVGTWLRPGEKTALGEQPAGRR